ncbi:MAG: YraN family protein [Defluviitaleaceae bacterium]|nr:YraN family protein [Defluviitaleaceae bacterium]
MKNQNREKGKRGEKIAVDYLQKKGYTIIVDNFYTRYGEIDIIAKDKEYIVFVEVKFRLNNNFGYPREAVDERKIKKIRTVAAYYMESMESKKTKEYSTHDIAAEQPRFDIIEILGGKVEHIINAF